MAPGRETIDPIDGIDETHRMTTCRATVRRVVAR
jgi:hypothetical protein